MWKPRNNNHEGAHGWEMWRDPHSLDPVRAVIRLVGPLREITSGAYQLVSVFSLASAICAAVLGLTPSAGVTAITPTVVAAAALLAVGFIIPLGHDVFSASLRCVTCAGEERAARGADSDRTYFLFFLVPTRNVTQNAKPGQAVKYEECTSLP